MENANSFNLITKPLGEILQEAGLINQGQLQVVLREQNIYTDLKIGEILALHGWLKQETADFFAETMRQLISEETCKIQIGNFFHQASLLSQKDIYDILNEQKKTGVKFGSIAVLKGFIKEQTLDFYLENFTLQTNKKTDFQYKDKETLTHKRLYLQNQNKSYLFTYYDLAMVTFSKANSVSNRLEKIKMLEDFLNLYQKIEELQTQNNPSIGKLTKHSQEKLEKIYILVLAQLAQLIE